MPGMRLLAGAGRTGYIDVSARWLAGETGMADGARNAARGFRYQYVRTLEALLDIADDPDAAGSVYVEGKPAPKGHEAQSVDYEVTDLAGRTLVAVQVKSRAPGGTLGPTDIFRALYGLARDRDARSYQLITNGTLGGPAVALVDALRLETDPGRLKRRIGEVLAAAGAPRAHALTKKLSAAQLGRLRRAEVITDPREDAEVHEELRARLRRYRNDRRAGLGDEAAGLMAGYLISEVFAGAADEARAEFPVAEFRAKLLVDGATLRLATGRRDWGEIVGHVPGWPDVHRAADIERIAAALPFRRGGPEVARCTLCGPSGIGKSSLAAAYVLDRADLYDVIFWVDAEGEDTILASFTQALAHLADTWDPGVREPALLRARVHDALARSAGRWLMVMDNCAWPRAAEQWIPRAGGGHVIVTTPDSALPSGAGTVIEAGPMTEAEAVTLLARRLPVGQEHAVEERALLARLAEEMKRWPLALELAAAYLKTDGAGIRGIPRYLATVKVQSLDHDRGVPLGYPRTLVKAIYLCLERIESQSARDGDPAGVAASAIWFAAYMSSRRIPVHLLITAVLIDTETAGGFTAASPAYAAGSLCPATEVVSLLRSQSLVSLDEPLPAEGLTVPGVPAAVFSVNSVLQEVLRRRRERDPGAAEHLIGRMAYHLALWLAAAHRHPDYPRTLAFAAHASALDGHAARLGADSDAVAFLRGNLAGVVARRGDTGHAAALLRAEITQVEGRAEDHCVSLCCQARIMLAGVLAGQEPPPARQVVDLLGSAFLVLQARAAAAPEPIAALTLDVRAALDGISPAQRVLDAALARGLARLRAAVADLLARLPDSAAATQARYLENAEAALGSRDPGTAIALCRKVLDQAAVEPADAVRARHHRHQAQRLIIEALADSGDWPAAAREFPVFLAMTEPAALHAAIREQLRHNIGPVVALEWLVSGEPAAAVSGLLRLITAPDVAGPVEAASPGHTAARIRLLRACGALAGHDSQAAAAHLHSALAGLPADGRSPRDDIWAALAAVITVRLARAGGSPPRREPPRARA